MYLQDDLAEHTMHSPVWQEHPADDTAEYWSDWDYYSDDYYDQGAPKRKRQRVAGESTSEAKGENAEGPQVGKRGRKLQSAEDIPELSLGESLDSDMEDSVAAKPTVLWRSKEAHDPVETPIVAEGEGEQVALLRDWRERFEVSSKLGRNTAAIKDPKTQRPNQRAVAVVIGPRPSGFANSRIDALKVSSKAKCMPSRNKIVPNDANGPLTSKPSTAKAKTAIATAAADNVNVPGTTKKFLRGTAILRQRANEVEAIAKKRSRPGAEEDATTDGDETIPRKRRAPATKEKDQENEAVQSAAQSDASSKRGRKRKALDEDDETITPQAVKRNAPAANATTGASEPKKGPTVPTRRNTRSRRD